MYACGSGKSGSSFVLCLLYFWVRALVRSGRGQVDVGEEFQLFRSCLNGRCRVCVSVISSLEPELDLAELGF